MKKINIFGVLSETFKVVLIYLLNLIWTRYFIKNLVVCLIISAIMTIGVYSIICFFNNKKYKRINNKKIEKTKIINYTNTFIFSKQSYTINFFYNLVKTKHIATKKTKYIGVENKIILYPIFLYNFFDENNLIEIYKKLSNVDYKKLIICTNKVNPNVYKLISTLPKEIIVLDSEEVYFKLLNVYNMYPIETKLKTDTKQTFKNLLNSALNKKRTKSYLLASMFLLFSSFFVPYKLYYLIFSSIMLTLTFVSFLNPKFNKVQNSPLFETK